MHLIIELSLDISIFRLHKFQTTVKWLFDFGVFLAWGVNQHAGCGSLGLASLSNFGSRLHVDVGHILVFAKDWKMGENIDGGNVGSNDNDSESIWNKLGIFLSTYPPLPLRTAFTVSLTPLKMSLSFMPFLMSLISFLLILSLASGSAIGLTKSLLSGVDIFVLTLRKFNLMIYI